MSIGNRLYLDCGQVSTELAQAVESLFTAHQDNTGAKQYEVHHQEIDGLEGFHSIDRQSSISSSCYSSLSSSYSTVSSLIVSDVEFEVTDSASENECITKDRSHVDEQSNDQSVSLAATQAVDSALDYPLPFPEEKMTEVQADIDRKEYELAIEKCTNLLEILTQSRVARPDITHRLQKMSFTAQLLNGETDLKCDYEGCSREQFIDLNLFFAEAITNKRIQISESTMFELSFYRYAALAGSPSAQLHLIQKFLFCEDDSPYLPFESMRLLLLLSQFPHDDLLKLLDVSLPFENTINDLLILLKTKAQSANNKPCAVLRDSIAKKLWHNPNPMIMMVVPFIYSTSEFGVVSLEQAMTYLECDEDQFDSEVNNSCGDIYRYWKILCEQKSEQSVHESKLTILANKGLLAAMFSLSEAAGWSGDEKKCQRVCLLLSKEKLLPKIFLSPDLCYSFIRCDCKFKLTVSESLSSKMGHKSLAERKESKLLMNEKLIRQAYYDGLEPSLFNLFSTNCKEALSSEKARQTHRNADGDSLDFFKHLLHRNRFALSTTVLIFTHIKQWINDEVIDDSLIEKAMQIDPLTTSLSMLYIGYFTREYSHETIGKSVMASPDLTLHSFDLYIEHDISKLLDSLTIPTVLYFSPDPNKIYKLIAQVRQANDKLKNIKPGVIVDGIHQKDMGDYSRYLTLSGDERLAKKFSTTFFRLEDRRIFAPGNSYIRDQEKNIALVHDKRFRQKQPDYHSQLRDISDYCDFHENNNTNIKKLIILYEKSIQQVDPEFLDKLADRFYYFLLGSSFHTSQSQFGDLLDKYKVLRSFALISSNKLIATARREIQKKAGQFSGLTKAQAIKELQDSLTSLDTFLQQSAEQVSIENQAKHLQTLSSECRLSTERCFISLYTEHKLVRKIAEETDHSQKLVLISQVVETSFYCPLFLLQQFPDQCHNLPEQDQVLAISILNILTKELSIRQQQVEVSYEKITANNLVLTDNFLYLHPTLYKHSDLHKQFENEFLKFTVSMCTKSAVEYTYIFDVTINNYLNEYKYCSLSYKEQFEILTQCPFLPMDIIAWVDTVKPKLTRRDIVSIKASIDSSRTESALSHLVAHYLSSKEESILFLSSFKQIKPKKMIIYAQMLQFALMAKIINSEQASMHQKKLSDSPIASCILDIHLEENPEPASLKLLKMTKLTNNSIKKLDYQSIFLSIGYKLFECNQIELSKQCIEFSETKYLLTMLQWKFSTELVTPTTIQNIPDTLLELGNHGDRQAQCRAMDWHLEHKNLHPNDLKRCCRYLLTEHYIDSPEKEFYQGIIWYLGISVEEDKGIAKSHFEIAFAHKSPIPCLRLLILQEKNLFPSDESELIVGGDLLETFSEKFLMYDRDVFIEILLSCGMKDLNLVIIALLRYTNAHQSTNSNVENTVKQLRQKVAEWSSKDLAQYTPAKPVHKLLPIQKRKPIKQMLNADQLTAEIKLHANTLQQSDSSIPASVTLLAEALNKLNTLQGKKFPSSNIDCIEWFHILFQSIEMNNQNKNLAKKLFKTIPDDKKQAVMIKTLDHMVLSAEIDNDLRQFQFIQARDLLITICPADFNIQTCPANTVSLLLKSYSLSRESLPRALINTFNHVEGSFLEDILLEQTIPVRDMASQKIPTSRDTQENGDLTLAVQPQIREESFPLARSLSSFTSLFEIYLTKIELPNETLLESAFSIPKKPLLRLTSLKLLCLHYPNRASVIFSTNKSFTNQYKLDLFEQLTEVEKQALISVATHGEILKHDLADTVLIDFKRTLKHPRQHSIAIATKLLSKTMNLKLLLYSYLELEKLTKLAGGLSSDQTDKALEIKAKIITRLITCTNEQLQKSKPFSDNNSWLLAVGIDRFINSESV